MWARIKKWFEPKRISLEQLAVENNMDIVAYKELMEFAQTVVEQYKLTASDNQVWLKEDDRLLFVLDFVSYSLKKANGQLKQIAEQLKQVGELKLTNEPKQDPWYH